jgi:hypothetical protein
VPKKQAPPVVKRPPGRPRGNPDVAAEKKRIADIERSRETTRKGSDIGEVPAVVNPERREACRLDLERFLVEYFPHTTGLSPFSDDHKRVIARIQDCLLRGGRFCNAVYRGFAKSTLSENAAIWATLYGHRRFVAIFAAEGGLADKAINSVKTELSENDLLYEDFPEVCHAVRAIEGKTQRCNSQTHQGKRTHIKWQKDSVVFPTIEGSLASGSIVASKGLGGSILGLRHKAADGRQLRPDFAIVDDPQTRESAKHPGQCETRLEVLRKSILKLAGHKSTMACVVNATVIQNGDMVDQLLDPVKSPGWQTERIPMVRKWSDRHEDLWLDKYATIRKTFDRSIVGDQARAHREANEFYLANQAEMDRGCEVSWFHCFDEEREHSAIQHAYNFLIDDGEDVFASECQQQPLANTAANAGVTTADIMAATLNVPRWVVPAGLDTLTAFVDVQGTALYWKVVAWGQRLRGHVVAYGTYPDQGRAFFTLRDVKHTLQRAANTEQLDAAIHAGLEAVATLLMDRVYERESDETEMRVRQLFIDCNWAQSASVVRAFCRRSKWGQQIIPTHGRHVGARRRSLSDGKPAAGERSGVSWVTATYEKQRHVLFDTNFWKNFVAGRIKLPQGDPQGITVHAGQHPMLCEQWTAEYPQRIVNESAGREVDEWSQIPGRDNHFWDCITGAAVAASYLGLSDVGAEVAPPPRRVAVSAEEARRRREEIMRRFG